MVLSVLGLDERPQHGLDVILGPLDDSDGSAQRTFAAFDDLDHQEAEQRIADVVVPDAVHQRPQVTAIGIWVNRKQVTVWIGIVNYSCEVLALGLDHGLVLSHSLKVLPTEGWQ